MTVTLNFKRYYKAYLLLGYAFLLFVHLVLKDHFFPLSVIFYAFPLPILIIITLGLTLILFRSKTFRISLIITSILLSILWYKNYYFTTQIEKQPNTSKILYWNLAKKSQLSVSQISDKVNLYQPEIIAFVEAPHTTLKNLDQLKSVLPQYNFITLKGAMLVGSKGEINLLKSEIKYENNKINLLQITKDSMHIRFILTDLTASLYQNKKIPLTYVSEFAKIHEVDFIIGDFNTPYESVHFNTYKLDFSSFHSYNDGFSATWPLGFPLYEIDHIWISNAHQPLRLHKFYNDASDHAMLISEYILNRK